MRVSGKVFVTQLTLVSFVVSLLSPAILAGENHPAPPNAEAIAASLKKRTAALDAVMKQFEKICMDPTTGDVLTNTAVLDPSTLDADQTPVMCGDEALRLNEAMNQLEADSAAAKAAGVQLDSEGPAPGCLAGGPSGSLGQLDSLAGTLGKNVDTNCCPNGKPPMDLFSGKCAEQAVCNAVRSSFPMIQGIASAVHGIDPKLSGSFAECAGATGGGSCFTEVIAGVLKDLWSNVTAIWDLAKLAGHGIAAGARAGGREIKHLWHRVRGIEDKTSEAALAASQQTPGALAQFRAHPIDFMKMMAKQLITMLWDWSKESFGCNKWAGVPHLSKCLEPITTFECASCDQKINVICGMAGLAGGEVLVAYFTGGAASAGKFALKAGAEATAKFAEVVKAIRPIAAMSERMAEVGSKVAEVGAKVGEVMSKVIRPATEAVEALSKTKAAVKVAEFAKTAATKGGALALKVAESAPVRVTIKMLSEATYPVRKYVELLNDAFKLGMKTMDRRMATNYAKVAGLAGLEKVHDFYYALGVGEGADGAAKGAELLADVKKSLNDDKIAYKEVTLADGKPGVEVELPGSSCPAGKVTFGVGK